jgi:photosystem II stability/assembly factor-like uncharacterized protein
MPVASLLRLRIAAIAVVALAGTDLHAADSGSWVDPIDAPAEILPLAAHSLLLGLAQSGSRYIAVGGRGEILLSEDGHAWRQVAVPTRITLTAVCAVDAQVWAVGHEGVILHSADGGEHWQMQRKDPPPTAGDDATRDPRRGAPLLDVRFVNPKRGYAVGAYSLALRTDDGGETWQPMTVAASAEHAAPATDKTSEKGKNGSWTFSQSELKIGEEATPHLNAITRTGSGALFIVGERGSAFRSRDDGATWQRLQLPYDGSMFGVLGFAGDHVLAFGLRGHVYESNDLGEHWEARDTGTELSLMGGAARADGGAVIVGANGIILTRQTARDPFHSFVDPTASVLAAVLPLDDTGTLLLVGENGVGTFPAN